MLVFLLADKDVHPKEREFLDTLSEKLELNRIEKKKMEKEIFS